MHDLVVLGPGETVDHVCEHWRMRQVYEGDDVATEFCLRCRRVRFEPDGKRAMAWYLDRTNPTGFRYAWEGVDPNAPCLWMWPGRGLTQVPDSSYDVDYMLQILNKE